MQSHEPDDDTLPMAWMSADSSGIWHVRDHQGRAACGSPKPLKADKMLRTLDAEEERNCTKCIAFHRSTAA